MLNVWYFCLALSLCILQVKSQSPEYTWEDYNGTIPEKAFLASDDPDNPVYVGMVFVENNNCTFSLRPGATDEVTVGCYGVHKVKEGLKILTVNDPTRFQWVETNVDIFWKVNRKGDKIESGQDPKRNRKWYVGRTITGDGTLEVGHISGGGLYYIDENNNHASTFRNYEVLVISKITPAPTPAPTPPTNTIIQHEEYAWEDYDGTIPEKAFLASDDPNNPVYIGMAVVNNYNCLGTLLPGATDITVQCYGIHKVQEGLKILTVKDPLKFQWLENNQDIFWEKVNSVGEAVQSGEDSKRKLKWLVGRTTDNGTLRIGHISGGRLHYLQENSYRSKTRNYEVLVVVKGPKPPSTTNQAYAWENYNGIVPENAFSVSDDVENPVYVGMGMVDGNNCTGSLLPKATELTVYCSHGYKLKDNIKILTVTDKAKFKWITMKYDSYLDDLHQWWDQVVGEELVVSNFNKTQGIYWYVARIATTYGSVEAGQMVNGRLQYMYKDRPWGLERAGFQVLAQIKEEGTPTPEIPAVPKAPSAPNPQVYLNANAFTGYR